MKRFLFILTVLIIGTNVFAEESTISQQAAIHYAENDIDKAFNLLLTIPEEDRSAQNYLLLGNILQDQGKNNEAIYMYDMATVADQKFYKAYYNLGTIYLEEEKPNLAIENLKKVIKLKPDYTYAYYNLGCAYIKTGDLKKARTQFIKAIELKNTVADFHYNLAYVYKKLNDTKKANLYLGYYNKLIGY